MSRNALALFALGVAGMLLITVARHANGQASRMQLASLAFAVVTLASGAFLIIRRQSIVQELVSAHDQSPRAMRRLYTFWSKIYHFATYEAYAKFNVVIGGVFFLALGLAGLGFFLFYLARGH
jgi:hypothetical protein